MHVPHSGPPYVTQVSWIRKRDLHILTSMSVTYTSDARFTVVDNPATDDWNLRIDYVQPRDAGIYECQVNTEPKIYRAVALKVLGEFPRGSLCPINRTLKTHPGTSFVATKPIALTLAVRRIPRETIC